MKTFMVTYTEDLGTTSHTILVCADTFTEAYLSVTFAISRNGVITELFEVV